MTHGLGQCFLKDKKALQNIAAALDISSTDTIVEIGPGHGELTKYILEKNPSQLILIEKDEKMASKLSSDLSGKHPNLKIIQGDALKTLPSLSETLPTNYKLAGNIPYYITGHLFRIIGELKNKPSLSVFTIQKEVAERAIITPDNLNILSASIAFWGSAEITQIIPKTSFDPQPKVDSATIKIKTDPSLDIDQENYFKIIKAAFKQPRKTLLNNLSENLDISKTKIVEVLRSINLSENSRPQNLSIKNIITLAKTLL